MGERDAVPRSAEERIEEDIRARIAALDVTMSYIVQAPAGSGKTELLIQRFLALLATVDAPEEIVAITFTRKAAGEMRVRIMQALDHAGEAAPEAEHARLTWELATAALRRDKEQGWQLLDQPSRLRIMTIDAFNGWLTRQMPWVTSMGTQVSVVDDAGELYREAVRSVVLGDHAESHIRNQLSRFLVHLDNRYNLAEDLLVNMLAVRDQWIPVLFRTQEGEASARGQMETVLRTVIQRHLSELCAEIPTDLLMEITGLARHAATTLEGMGILTDESPMRSCTPVDAMAGDAAENLPVWLGIAQLLVTGTGSLRKPRGVDKRLGFVPSDPQKKRLQDILEKLEEYPLWCDRLAAVRGLPSAQYEDGQWGVLDDILQILLRSLDELQKQFLSRGVLDHAQMAFAAADALGNELEPTELALLMEYRLRHLLVDEFQDTSSTQFRLLKLLTSGWSAADDHTLFLVGDPMQSIYRFREAEVGLFLTVWEQERLASVPLKPLRLYRNFRSQEGIVSWVNARFSSIMPDRNDPETGAVAFVSAAAVNEAERHAVAVDILHGASRREEADHVSALCREVLEQPGMYGENAAILVRSRSHILEILPRLRAASIRCQAVEIEPLGKHPAVQDILALARALSHPGDRIAWLAVLRAPWCGLKEADLHALAAPNPRTLLCDVIVDDAAVDRLTEDGRQRIIRCRTALLHATEQQGRKSFRRLVEGCWIELGGPATTDAAGLDAARSCLDLIESLSPAGELPALETLYREIEQLYAPPDPGADVRLQIMTIHKAKGLQFDTVIVPRLDGTPRNANRRLLLWMEQHIDDEISFIMAPLAPRGEDEDQTYRYLRSVLAKKDEYETLRLLYVAVTRAKRRLCLTATVKQKEDPDEGFLPVRPVAKSFLGYLWDDLGDEASGEITVARKSPESPVDLPSGASVVGRSMTRLRSDWKAPEVPALYSVSGALQEESEETHVGISHWHAGRKARHRGIVFHRLLAEIGKRGPAWWEKLEDNQRHRIVRAIGANAAESAPDILTEEMLTGIETMLSDERGRWILYPHREGRCEYALSGIDQDKVMRAVIDRTFIDADGCRWIIDYKVSLHEGGDLDAFLDMQADLHREQLHRYAVLLRLREQRPVRAALYFPLQKAWRVLIQ